jgi:hypothetical protein
MKEKMVVIKSSKKHKKDSRNDMRAWRREGKKRGMECMWEEENHTEPNWSPSEIAEHQSFQTFMIPRNSPSPMI